MSLTVDGVWKVGVWATTAWADGVWSEGVSVVPLQQRGGQSLTEKEFYALQRKQVDELIQRYKMLRHDDDEILSILLGIKLK